MVMAALVGGVDAPKALLQGDLGQGPGVVLLPGGPVQEARHTNAFDRQGPLGHRLLRLGTHGDAGYPGISRTPVTSMPCWEWYRTWSEDDRRSGRGPRT